MDSYSEEDENALALICMAACAVLLAITRKRMRNRRIWTSHFLRSRETHGGNALLEQLQVDRGLGLFQNFCRMSPADFNILLGLIERKIMKMDTNYRKAITAQEKLALTLRFLATGDSYASLKYLFKISKSSIIEIIPAVCEALVEALEKYIKVPRSQEQWLEISERFEELWNFPHCLGAIDARHCQIQAPAGTGSDYYCYKGFFSIVLLGVADADYCFIYTNVGSQGRISDGGVVKNTQFWRDIQNGDLGIPPESPLPGRTANVPYVLVADDAFALHQHFLKPYTGNHETGSTKRIFNYRLCRARRIIENVFGIVSSVFRVLRKPLLLEHEKSSTVIQTCTYLHNFLRKSSTSRNLYTPSGSMDEEINGHLIPGTWREDSENTSFIPLQNRPRRTYTQLLEMRNEFAEYCVTDLGKVPWQKDYC